MPWKEVSFMEERKEFVILAMNEAQKVRSLCRRFGVSPTTGYKWLRRYQEMGAAGLYNKSRRPHSTPKRTSSKLEGMVFEIRQKHQAWGGRTIHKRLKMLGVEKPPQPSTITKILHRQNQIKKIEHQSHRMSQRFERSEPNELWQMDFKSNFRAGHSLCCPLTLVDDYSRFLVGLKACNNQRHVTVQSVLVSIFRRYGMPQEMLMDNGTPWRGNEYQHYSLLTAWLIRLGIRVIHGRPHHPQTQGKAERFHKTLQNELLHNRIFRDLLDCQKHFDEFRETYNFERPHQSLDMDTPGQRYRISVHKYPEKLPPIEYSATDQVRMIDLNGFILWKGKSWRIGKAFRHQPVAVRPTIHDGFWDIFYCHQRIAIIDQNREE